MMLIKENNPLDPEAELFPEQCFLIAAALDSHAVKFQEDETAFAHCCALSVAYSFMGVIKIAESYMTPDDEAKINAEIEKMTKGAQPCALS